MKKVIDFLAKTGIYSLAILDTFIILDYFKGINFELMDTDFDYSKLMKNTSFASSDTTINQNDDKAINNNIPIAFSNIKLDMSLNEVEELVGKADRVDVSSYGFNWHVYNRYKNTFFMIGINNNKVVGLYSNTNNNAHLNEIKIHETDIDYIRGNFKIEEIQNNEKEYDVLKTIGHSITVYYDIHENNRVTSFEVIKNKYINKRDYNFYSEKGLDDSRLYNEKLKKSSELQMFDLINSTREKFGLSKLEYDDDKAHDSSIKHALDMEENNYFAHDNLKGESPFDRMKKEGINYSYAGENLAGGHISVIRAHEALMNSKGHRDITLTEEFEKVGIGVEFGGERLSHYVQNYYSEK